MRLTLFFAGLAAVGCADVTAPESLYMERPAALMAPGTGPHAARVGDFIVVDGRVGFPDPCHALDARAARRAGWIEVSLRARRVGDACIQILGSSTYRIFVPAAPGPTRLTVRYDGAIAGGPFELTVP